MSRPIAVLISDIHFTVPTLELATKATVDAMTFANDLRVPLLMNGDTLDGKSILQAKVVNELIALCSQGPLDYEDIYINVGNHDLLNEKDSAHALNFLAPYARVISHTTNSAALQGTVIPYQTSTQTLNNILACLPDGHRIFCHQGVQTANMGHYVQDKTSLPPSSYARFKTYSGHYHCRQTIKCGDTGSFSYIGNPYTNTFGEAGDPPKGFQVLYEDDTLLFIPSNLRKHIVVERDLETLLKPIPNYNPGDLVMLKVKAPFTKLQALNKQEIGERLFGHSNYKLDRIATDAVPLEIHAPGTSDVTLFDQLIDNTDEDEVTKVELKQLWRKVIE